MYACNTVCVAIPIRDYKEEPRYHVLRVIKKGTKYVYVCTAEYEELLSSL